MQGQLSVTRLDAAGSYKLAANVDATQVKLRLQADEPPHGLIAGVAKLPDLGAISINATLDGPRDAVATRLSVTPVHLRRARTAPLISCTTRRT